MTIRPIPEAIFQFVISHEAMKLKAYLCPAGRWTIGAGHTRGVTPDMTVTLDEGMELLRDDLTVAAKGVCAQVKSEILHGDLTDNQYSALIDFVFNFGPRPDATLWKVINRRDFGAVPGELLKWRFAKVNGKSTQLEGLLKRRVEEIVLWCTGEPGSVAMTPAGGAVREMAPTPAPETAKPMIKDPVIVTGAGGAAVLSPAVVKTIWDKMREAVEHGGFHITTDTLLMILAVIGVLLVGLTLFYILRQKRDARR